MAEASEAGALELLRTAAHAKRRPAMWIMDFPTLLLVVTGAIHLGAVGLFGPNVIAAVTGRQEKPAEAAIGISGVWQTARQFRPRGDD